jgi:DeoR/GlpR family transcriptional regulator of sugar metabolism
MHRDEYTPQQRAALITKWLMRYGRVTEQQLIDGLGITGRVARRTLVQLSVVLPIRDNGNTWEILEQVS